MREFDPENSELNTLTRGEHDFDKRTMTYPASFLQGDLYLSWLRGGAGLGDPLERDPRRVADDVNQGFLLPHYAPKIYGVKLEQIPDGSCLPDSEGTDALRDEIRKSRTETSIPTRAYLEKERQRVKEGRFMRPIRECYNACMALSPDWARRYREFWNLPDDFTFPLEAPFAEEPS